jgi:hypothetical protein
MGSESRLQTVWIGVPRGMQLVDFQPFDGPASNSRAA